MRQGAELLGAGDKVGFAAQLHQRAHAPAGVDVGLHQPLRGLPVGAPGGLLKPLLAQRRRRPFQAAVVILQGTLAVADAGAGLFAQGFN